MRTHSVFRSTHIAFAAALLLTVVTHAAESGVDVGVKPGDDFFAYANGEWLKTTEIPVGQGRFGARNEIDEKTKRQLAALFADSNITSQSAIARKVIDFRAAYLDEATIESKGTAPLQARLKRIDAVKEKAALTRLLGEDMRADVDPLNWGVYSSARLFGLSVERGIHGETKNFAYLLQGGLGLPNRDYYLSVAPAMQAVRSKYLAYVGRLLELAGVEHSKESAQSIVGLETSIAQCHSTDEESSPETNADNRWRRVDFEAQAPGMDWNAFFVAAGLSKQQILVAWQPRAIKCETALIASERLAVWKDYLQFHAINDYVDVLPRSFADEAFALYGAQIAGLTKRQTRDQLASEATNKYLPELVGRLYVEKYFPAKTKAKVQAIVANVKDAFAKRIDAIKWMSYSAKNQAQAKLKTLYFGVGYPEQWTDYSTLAIDAHDAIGNLERIAVWNYRHALAKLDQPTSETEWVMSPQTVAAILMPLQNAYNFSAALLQAPKFDPSASDAENYGAIGAIAGHEISHFVDTLGADYNAQGARQRWWKPDDLANYQAACAPLIKQFSSYQPFADLAIDGKLTLSENIADLGGLAAAFDAHRRALGGKANDKEFVRQQDRQFFIGFARAWRAKLREDALRKQVATNDHAPESYRVATVRNIDAWYEAFDVRPGQKLYLAPKDRVRIW